MPRTTKALHPFHIQASRLLTNVGHRTSKPITH